jgi:light-regulated signal transduction histidine kinase (bacteriophytochrome)
MKAASAMQLDPAALEDLGRATLRIVHDLKNQLNGLKLYATFLRKRLERDEHSQEERETIEKLVAGLDRAARDLTALVRYAQPLDLRQQSGVDLRSVIQAAAKDPAQRVTGALSGSLLGDISDGPLVGVFDPHSLADAFSSLAREAFAGRSNRESGVTLHAERSAGEGSAKAVIEWRGLTLRDSTDHGIHAQFAKRAIEAHGGVVEFDRDKIRVTLPLSE